MINQLLNPVLTQSTATMEEKVILTLEGTTIHSLNELREHFNRNEILSFYSDGRLLTKRRLTAYAHLILPTKTASGSSVASLMSIIRITSKCLPKTGTS